jgi:proline iminopeptidase
LHKLLLLLTLSASSLYAQLPHATGTVHTPEVDLGYETFGSPSAALPVIAVNGGPGLSHKYMLQNDMWQKVAAHRLVVFYDQRGTGASKHLAANAPQTMEAQVADLEAVRAYLKLERAAFVGDSYGGLLVIAYAAAHPEHVAKLVLSDAAPPAWKDMVHLLPQVFPDIEESGEATQKRMAADPEAAAQEGLINHFRMIFYSPTKLQAYLTHMGDIGYVPAVGEAVSKATENIDLTTALPRFSFPTLVITGRYDMNVAPLTAWRMAHEIPGARIVFFEESGHLPSYEEPEKYLQVLNEFLN